MQTLIVPWNFVRVLFDVGETIIDTVRLQAQLIKALAGGGERQDLYFLID